MQDVSHSSPGFVREILEDREKGAARLVAERHGMLYAAAYSLCGDAAMAEDLVFRTFERVLERIASCRDETAFDAWMKAILRNEWLLSIRSPVARATMPAGTPSELEHLAEATDGASAIRAAADHDIVRSALDSLPHEEREVLLLHYFADLTVAQIAKFVSIPAGTVMSRLFYARRALAAKLGAAAKKPGAKALLIALALCGLTALGAAVALVGDAAFSRVRRDAPVQEQQAESGKNAADPSVPSETADSSGSSDPSGSTGLTGMTGLTEDHLSTFDFGLSTFNQPTQEENMNATTLRTFAASAALAVATGAPLAANANPALGSDLQAGLTLWLDAGQNVRSAAGAVGAEVTDAGASVNEWYDVRETSFASPSFPHASVYAENAVAPALASFNGMSFVDFGDFASGKWMIFQAPGGTYPRYAVRSAFFVLRFGEQCNYPLGSVSSPTYEGGETCFTRGTLYHWWGYISDYSYGNSVLPWGESRLNGLRINPATDNFVQNAVQMYSQVGPGSVQRTFYAASPDTLTGNVPWANTLFNDRNYRPGTVNMARQGGGALGEMLIYDRVVSDSERARIEAYLAEKWLGRATGAIAYPTSETEPIALATGEAQVFGRPAGRVYLAPTSGVAVAETAPVSRFEGAEGGSRLAATDSTSASRFQIGVAEDAGGLILSLDPATLGSSDIEIESGTVMLSSRPTAAAVAAAIGDGADAAALESAAEAERTGYEATPGNMISNGSFETPLVNYGNYYAPWDPTGWTRSGNVYLCCGTSTPWWTRTGRTLADGNQFVACQANSSSAAAGSFVSQEFTAPFAGIYRAVVRVSHRDTGTPAPGLAKLDGGETWYHMINYAYDARGTSDDWLEYEFDLPPLAAGQHTLSLGIEKSDSTDRTALFDAVRVYPVAAGEFVAVPNPGFEAGPSLTTADGTANANGVYPGRYQYSPASAHTFWTFSNGGITQQDTTWWRISADGKAGWELRDQRKGFLQLGANSTTAYADATINAPRAGRVRLTMRLSKRWNSGALGHWLDIVVGGSAVGRAWPVGNAQEPFACEFDIAAGSQTLRLSMGKPESMLASDLAIIFDDIRIQYIDGAAVSAFVDPTRGSGTLAGWTATGGAALVRNGNATPNGILEMPAGAAMETSFTLSEGGWLLLDAFAAGAARETSSSNGVYNSYLHYPARAAVSVDGIPAGVIQAESDEFERFTLRTPYLGAGLHTLRIERETVNLATAAKLRLKALEAPPVEVAVPADAIDATLRVADGAILRLDYPGKVKVRRLKGPDGRDRNGVVDSVSCADFLAGPGYLEIVPPATIFVVR